MDKSEKSKMGKASRQAGKRFELIVRKDLEKEGWIVVKWANQIDFDKGILIPAKNKYNPFLGRIISSGGGFPDYLCYKPLANHDSFEVIGVESKIGKYLDAKEKKKAEWLINHKVFSHILVAYKKKRGEIAYDTFNE